MSSKKQSLIKFLVFFFTIIIGSTIWSHSQTSYFMPGKQTGYDYFIYKDGSNSYSKNAYGQIACSGIESYVINSVLASNREIFITSGIYNLDSPISLTGYENLVLEGNGLTTKLKLKDNIDANVIQANNTITQKENIIIKNLQIDGNKDNNVDGDPSPYRTKNGIYLVGVNNSRIEGIIVHDCIYSGIKIISSGGDPPCYYNIITNNIAYANGHNGIQGYISYYTTISNNIVYDNGGSAPDQTMWGGIYVTSGQWNIISNNICEGNKGDGIELYTQYLTTVSANNIYNNSRFGIYLAGGSQNIVIGNFIQNSSADGIRDTGSYDQIIGNSILHSGLYPSNLQNGIYLTTSSTEISVIGNIIFENSKDGILVWQTELHIINDNQVYNNIYNGIELDDSNNCTLIGNLVRSNDKGIIESNNSNFNIIIGCRSVENTGINIGKLGSNTKVNLCWNGTTWIS